MDSSGQLYEADTLTIILVLWLRKLRLRDSKQFTQDHTAKIY
jgi:hypothetical protein